MNTIVTVLTLLLGSRVIHDKIYVAGTYDIARRGIPR